MKTFNKIGKWLLMLANTAVLYFPCYLQINKIFLDQLSNATSETGAGTILQDFINNGVPGTAPTPSKIIDMVNHLLYRYF